MPIFNADFKVSFEAFSSARKREILQEANREFTRLASSKKLIHAKQNKTTFSFYIFMKLLFHIIIIMATRRGLGGGGT